MSEKPDLKSGQNPLLVIILVILFLLAGLVALIRGRDPQMSAVRPENAQDQ